MDVTDADLAGAAPVIAINRAAAARPCTHWCILDAESYDDIAPIGEPVIITTRKQWDRLTAAHGDIAGREHILHTEISDAPPARKLGWKEFSALTAIVAAASKGATQIDVYGMDLAGDADYDGVRLDRHRRDDVRWAQEKRLFDNLAEWYGRRGVIVTRKTHKTTENTAHAGPFGKATERRMQSAELPKLIHFVWVGPGGQATEMPTWAKANIERFRELNPDHEVKIHGEEVLIDELRDSYRAAMEAWGPSSGSDLLRYSALRRYGGWYFDVDFRPLRPLADAERAWQMDGSRVFVARQQHNKNTTLTHNGAMMASGADAAGLRRLIDMAAASQPERRVSYGPALITQAVSDAPREYIVSDACWWYPLSIAQAAEAWGHMLAGDDGPIASVDVATGGQMPYAAHLWAETNATALATAPRIGAQMRPKAIICLRVTNGRRAEKHPFGPSSELVNAIKSSLEVLGYSVSVGDDGKIERGYKAPKVVFVWNGIRNAKAAAEWEKTGAAVFRVEQGFFDRPRHYQVDHEGILHRTSWRNLLIAGEQPPDDAREKLHRYVPGVKTQGSKRGGYVLVLGQVANDSQLADSEISGPIPLARLVRRVMRGKKIECFFRPHPADTRSHRRVRMPVLGGGNEKAQYRATGSGPQLADALAGAKFVVTINSNAITEALAAGVPVLAFGPSLAIYAGAAHPTSSATLAADIDEMLGGWRAPQVKVVEYLAHLAGRQYSAADLAKTDVMARLLGEAGL
jgi:hypothetical protein